MFKRLRHKAATLLQKTYRLGARTRRCRRERKAILAAAGVLQHAVRGWAARRAAHRKRQERRRKRAAIALQRAARAYLQRCREHRLRVAAALTLWKFTGGLSAQLSRIRKRREASAATRIQSLFRVRTSRVRVAELHAKRRGIAAASIIQAVTRGHRTRVKTRALLSKRREEHTAGTKIQAASRGHITRLRTRALRSRRRECAAAIVIQALFRGHRSRAETRSHQKERRACAGKIQGLPFRQGLLRNPGDHEERSALVLQQAWRKSKGHCKEVRVREPPTMTPVDAHTRRGSSLASSCSMPQRAPERASLELAVQALANGMSRRGVITAFGARHLKQTMSLREDDPALEDAVLRKLSCLEVALKTRGKVPCRTPEFPAKERTDVEQALRGALGELERHLFARSA